VHIEKNLHSNAISYITSNVIGQLHLQVRKFDVLSCLKLRH